MTLLRYLRRILFGCRHEIDPLLIRHFEASGLRFRCPDCGRLIGPDALNDGDYW